MSKFVIECPKCGRYAEAKTGFFARKKIECTCGNVINVRVDKMTSRVCPHCGNTVIFDQSKGADAKCPVCQEPINTAAEQDKNVEFSCAQCGVRLRVSKSGADSYTCPVCDFVNDVAERLQSEKIRHAGLPSVIKYEGDNSTFIWKSPIEDFVYGSQLIVHESQEAIFFRDGEALDTFPPGRHALETQKLPLMDKVYQLPTSNEGTFHSEVYFINKTVQMAIKWGTRDRVRFIDPLTGTPLELGASGEMNLMVSNGRKLLTKLVGAMKGIAWNTEEGKGRGFTKSLEDSFRPLIASAVKTNLPAAIKQNEIDVLEIDEKLDLISASLLEKIKPGFEEYGLTVPQFYVTGVVLPEEDPNFKRIRELHTIVLQTRVLQGEAAVRTVEEQAKAQVEAARRGFVLQQQETETEVARRAAERTVIAADAEAEAKRRLGIAEAEVMKAQGYNYQDVLRLEGTKAVAEGIGNMGPAIGGGGGSPMGDILGIGMGLQVARQIVPEFGSMMQGMQTQTSGSAASPEPAAAAWDCPKCGRTGITWNFCPDCGEKKPAPRAAETWNCPVCGMSGLSSDFCPECGTKRVDPARGWICPNCGAKDIRSKFCPACGTPKPVQAQPETWTCPNCGRTGITGRFCPDCGKKGKE